MNPIFFPSTSACNMVKNAPNHIPQNMIGQAHTSCETQKDNISLNVWWFYLMQLQNGLDFNRSPQLIRYYIIHLFCGGYQNLYIFCHSMPVWDTHTHDQIYMNIIILSYIYDLFQPKMSPTLSFSGMYRKKIIHRRNRTNSQ